jgi:stearoyl-CoA 9-desaturase NADPH oxidoreductase
VAEQGARPKVPKAQRRILKAARALTTPLLPDDYLEMINPLWSTRELRGRVERIKRETADAVTIEIRPGYEWPGHAAGQYVRVGFDIDGVRHWRAYSLTSEPDRPDGFLSVTPKLLETGKVTPHVHRGLRPGDLVFLSDVEGQFVLPDPLPGKLLFISAGSGVTPIMSMLRSLARQNAMEGVVHIHSSRTPDDVIFGEELRDLGRRHHGFRLCERHTGSEGRMQPADIERICPDWRERETFASGPGPLLDALSEHWDEHGDCDRLHMERFQPVIGGEGAAEGEGGTITFLKSGREIEGPGDKPILVAGEESGLELPFGCRMGICHTCVGRFRSGKVRDLRSGEVTDVEGVTCRTCVNAPEGPVEIEL